jgi:arginyl-tRNA synthetase
MAACFGDDPDTNLELIIGQLVSLTRDGERVRMSKRTGALVTLREIIDLLGVDAAR